MIFTEEHITDLVKTISGNLKNRKAVDEIQWNPIYGEAIDLARRIGVHADYDVKPVKLLEDGYPGEEQVEIDYRLRNYKNRTMSYWDRALGETRIIWNSRWSIDWHETNEGFAEDDNPEDYFTTEYPLYRSFLTWYKTVLHDEKFNDPNQVVAVEPWAIPMKQEDDVFEIDQTQRIEPYAVIYRSAQVIQYVRGSYFLALTDETTVIKDGAKEVDGLVFKLYDQNSIWKIKQTGTKRNYTFEISLYYTHNWGQLPCRKLEGTIKQKRGEILYLSYFYDAVAGLDIATQQFSTLDLVIKKHAYPIKAYTYDDCSECGGRKEDFDGKVCGVCNGSGRNRNISPLKDVQVKLPDRNAPDEAAIFPGIQYITPNVDVIKFLDENTKEQAANAFLAINIDVTIKPNGTTATEKKIDQESRHAFFVGFSTELFDLMGFLIDAIGYMRYTVGETTKWVEPTINPPIEFSMSSAKDLMEEIKLGFESNLPDVTIRELLKEHLRQRYPSNTALSKVMDIVLFVDPLITKTSDDILKLNATQSLEKWKIILHNEILTWVEDTPEYLDQDLATVKASIEARAKASVPASLTADALLAGIDGVTG